MDLIEEGDFFEISSPNQEEAVRYVYKKLQDGETHRSNIVIGLQNEEIYKQKQDAKDFLKNLTRSRNHEIVNSGRFTVALTSKTGKKVKVDER